MQTTGLSDQIRRSSRRWRLLKVAVLICLTVIAIPILFFVVVNNLPAWQFASTESPDKTYTVNLRGRKSSPKHMFVMHSVYFVTVVNQASKPIKFLQIEINKVELFLLFDLDRQARATLSFRPQRDEGWMTIEGEFEDGTKVVASRVTYYVVPIQKNRSRKRSPSRMMLQAFCLIGLEILVQRLLVKH